MAEVHVERELDATPERVREAMRDVEAFMRAGGFDEVVVDGDRIELTNRVGLPKIRLTLRVVDRPDATLAYEQVDGIFESMETRYGVEDRDGTTVATATTEFAVDLDFVGGFLDSTVVSAQRRREIASQFDYLEREA